MSTVPGSIARELNQLLAVSGLPELSSGQANAFEAYCELLIRWNARTNLTAIRDVDGILLRHFLESIVCARAIPGPVRTLLDFGSGAGFPGIPIALCRPEIAVTLAESQGKKAAFLREAARVLQIPLQVHSARAETLESTFDCVTLRAVDHMGDAIHAAVPLVVGGGWLVLLGTGGEAVALRSHVPADTTWSDPIPLPGSIDRVLLVGRRP